MIRVGNRNAASFGRLFLCCLILAGLTGCAGFKIVRIPIPVPTFGLGGTKTAQNIPDRPRSGRKTQENVGSVSHGVASYGMASWYGKECHKRPTASGERFNMYDLTAAHPTLPFGTFVRVTNVDNGKSCILRINDRGPFGKNRIIDVSLAAARELDFENKGITQVRIEVM